MFETAFACLDAAREHREKLARILFALNAGVKELPPVRASYCLLYRPSHSNSRLAFIAPLNRIETSLVL